jgi:signal transduction histidine kinase
MVRLIRYAKKEFFGAHLEFRVRMFNVLAMAGTLVALSMGCVNIASDKFVIGLIDWASAVAALCLLIYSVRTQKYVRCYYITIFTVFLSLFPYLYFVTGGYMGGTPMFFLFSVVFTALMLEERPAAIVLFIEVIVYCGCFAVSYFFPDLVKHFPDESQHFIGNTLSFAVAAVSLGMVALLQFRLYNAQQKKLDEQNVILAQANRAKTEFLANASHEMRTPLTVTSVNVQVVMRMLEDMGEALGDTEAKELLKNAQSEIMRLSRMVGGMLTLASMSEDTDRRKLDYTALLRSGIEMLRLTFAENGIALRGDIESGLTVFGNADLLAQVLTNLLQNARAHTKNGEVAVRAKKHGGEITVTVRDTGSGISPEMLPRVFERGVSSGGTGFGLFLCKTVVESHGGKMWIESEPEIGTSAYYSLPVYEGQIGGGQE